MLKHFKKPISADFVVIDSQFPQKDPFAFKNAEVNEYFERVSNFKSFTMSPMKPGKESWFSHGYGISEEEFIRNKEGYLNHYPQKTERINYLFRNRRYKFSLAYTYFLAETFVLLPFLEKNRIPFVFVLYPGGGFGLNNIKSDNMLKKIFSSKYFRAVITTQNITNRYIVDKGLCEKDKAHFIYGGFVQFKVGELIKKKYYKKDKKTFDICFVAAKYSDKGVDKGYDIFIESAKILAKQTNDIHFHVIGGFNEHDINVSELGSRINFYGFKKPEFLKDFYSKMDIFLGPSRPNKLFEGNFDGFPLGIDSSFCGVALFVSDELKMNDYYINSKDIEIVELNADKISKSVIEYYKNIDKLYELSHKGQIKTQKLFDIDHQINERLRIFNKFTTLKYSKDY